MTAPAPTVLHVVEGQVEVSGRADAVFSTVVGSCVSACLWDPVRGLGGMNHFLLPGDAEAPVGLARRQGVHLMELLINRLMAGGADRSRLQAKAFGGAALRRGLTAAGERNADFVEAFLAREGIPLVGHALRGTVGRRVEFWPASGRARVKPTAAGVDAPRVTRPPAPPAEARVLPTAGEPEFF